MTVIANPALFTIVACAERTLGYGELLARDIPAEKFGHMPLPNMNHAAFNYGHLSLYPNRVFTLMGRPECCVVKEGWEELFKAGAPCVEQDGRYPSKDEIVSTCLERYRAAIDLLRDTPDEILAEENPAEGRMKEIFPTLGVVINFLMNNHAMMHFGQVSAWRRAIGFGSVM